MPERVYGPPGLRRSRSPGRGGGSRSGFDVGAGAPGRCMRTRAALGFPRRERRPPRGMHARSHGTRATAVRYSASGLPACSLKPPPRRHERRFRRTIEPRRASSPGAVAGVAAEPASGRCGAVLSVRHIPAHGAALPPPAHVLGVRDRGAARARGAAGRLARGVAHRAVPSVRHERIRPGPGARKGAAAVRAMIRARRFCGPAFPTVPASTAIRRFPHP